ncbi:amino acid transporter heavy chain SLC3A2 isoform X2 [Nothobranchius furzeri]|uniref:Transcript variant X1 n=1 Tax=Nothobranchius furzeri TaxID=105023 RepID=A0A9D3BRX5_NOTFU|nr:4F2 cell-surface antigen heavy chain isoform X1 [Nothobranchius furzeri]KAF7218890.1 transcript variant X1 [Nothobranchius furzeri]KAF7218891.1 transcript variant X2 [Nothobranchius furzeri]
MPLNAGNHDPVQGKALSDAEEASETTPLLPPASVYSWQPLTKQELEAAAGSPEWRATRHYLVLAFWLTWVTMLAAACTIVVLSPRPVPTCLKWWQKSLFYRLQPELTGSEGNNVSDHLLHLQSLGVGALILEGVFHKKASLTNLSTPTENLAALAQIQHLFMESKKAGLRVVLDLCKATLLELEEAAWNSDRLSNYSSAEKHALRFWLEQGVAGFVICDTDEAYSEETLLEWRGVLEEFGHRGVKKIIVVKQTSDVLRPIRGSNNVTLVNMVLKSILPKSHHHLSADEVVHAVEAWLQMSPEEAWSGWSIGGKVSHELKRLLLVLMMTLPGSPALQHKDIINQTKSQKTEHSATVALLTTLSHSKAKEEALLYGSFTFLPVNGSSNSSSNSSSSPAPVLAFLRSWGCVQFLILLNFGSDSYTLDPAWASSLPEKGVFVASTGMNHLGSMSLFSFNLQPREAIVVKLFKAGSYS